MGPITRNLIGLLLMTSFWPATDAVAETAEALPKLSAVESSIVTDAHELYGAAGLTLPEPVRITFHDSLEPCAGNLALYTNELSPSVRVCWTHENPAVERRVRTRALVHELAHAWVDGNVDDRTKLAYLLFTGLDSWRDRDEEWTERGTEHAAELITWAVLDPEVSWIDFATESCHRWPIAYSLLTGEASTEALEKACDRGGNSDIDAL